MEGKEKDAKQTLETPDEIRQSKKNEKVLIYYRKKGNYNTCVVIRVTNGEGFIITTYETDRVKEGTTIWEK